MGKTLSIAIVGLLTVLCLILDDIEWSLEGKGWKDELGTDSTNRDDDSHSDISDYRSDRLD